MDEDILEAIVDKIEKMSLSENIEISLLDLLGSDNIELIEDIINDKKLKETKRSKKVPIIKHHYSTNTNKKITRKKEKYWEEMILEKITSENKYKIEHYKISDLPSSYKKPFPFIHFNKMQSVVIPSIINRNESILVCSPTGTGKTEIALMAITKIVTEGKENKSIYIAPMKALVGEIVHKLRNRLRDLNVKILECTGDKEVKQSELDTASVIVATPEKWDIITRKENIKLEKNIKLLIIDEIHLLRTERGATLETIVSRTLRKTTQTQSPIRILGLSATLPNYIDVAMFIGANPESGVFYFGEEFRATPLECTLCSTKKEKFDELCFEKTKNFIKDDQQVLVFTHTRRSTTKTATMLINKLSSERITLDGGIGKKEIKIINNIEDKEIRKLAIKGISVHHAGVSRGDRDIIERLFSIGCFRILVSTSTLAWGVNLPAHGVIIKGTEVYNQEKGSAEDISILDVVQMFGRAGRPQFDDYGEAILISTQKSITSYFNALALNTPIESQFMTSLLDNLNTEVVSGTVCRTSEGIQWLRRTYMYIRMLKNPLAYGIQPKEMLKDPLLQGILSDKIENCYRALLDMKMVEFIYELGENRYIPTEIGIISCLFYVKYRTVSVFIESIELKIDDPVYIISQATEFESINVREEEIQELELIMTNEFYELKNVIASREGKIALLIHAYITNASIKSSSLRNDMIFIIKNVERLLSALLEISLVKGYRRLSITCVEMITSIRKKQQSNIHPLQQLGFNHKDTLDTLKEIGVRNISDLFDKKETCDFINKDISTILKKHPLLLIASSILGRTISVQIKTDFIRDFDTSWILMIENEKNIVVEWRRIVFSSREKNKKIYFNVSEKNKKYYIYTICEDWYFTENVEHVKPSTENWEIEKIKMYPITDYGIRTGYIDKELNRLLGTSNDTIVLFANRERLFKVAEALITVLSPVEDIEETRDRKKLYSSFGIYIYLFGEYTNRKEDSRAKIRLVEKGVSLDMISFRNLYIVDECSDRFVELNWEEIVFYITMMSPDGNCVFFVDKKRVLYYNGLLDTLK
eukprot:GHVP01060499.1.p1 GENE.GHVP01060499.1~~GHVP01060499.1.p1  ORF type:complete len:1097 (+),score=212.20 GHVP01060499.1:152-3292(+)